MLPICLAIFISLLRHCHFDPIDSAWVRMHAIIFWFFWITFPAHMSFWTWAGYRPIKLLSNVPLSIFNLSILNQTVGFWSLDLEIIIPLILSIESVSGFYNPMSLHWFFFWLWADTHIRSFMDHQNLVGFYPTTSFIFNHSGSSFPVT